jgi:hypothetical protein
MEERTQYLTACTYRAQKPCELKVDVDDHNALLAFLFTCAELKDTAFGRQFKISVCKSYRLQPNTVRSTKCRIDDNDHWRSFVLSFRKLVLNSEIGNINRVLNVLSRSGSKSDQQRIRQIKRELKAVEISIAGAAIGVGESCTRVEPKAAFEALANGVLFHNDLSRQSELAFFREAGIFAFGAMLHYVIYTYKQALRIEGAIRLRGIA